MPKSLPKYLIETSNQEHQGIQSVAYVLLGLALLLTFAFGVRLFYDPYQENHQRIQAFVSNLLVNEAHTLSLINRVHYQSQNIHSDEDTLQSLLGQQSDLIESLAPLINQSESEDLRLAWQQFYYYSRQMRHALPTLFEGLYQTHRQFTVLESLILQIYQQIDTLNPQEISKHRIRLSIQALQIEFNKISQHQKTYESKQIVSLLEDLFNYHQKFEGASKKLLLQLHQQASALYDLNQYIKKSLDQLRDQQERAKSSLTKISHIQDFIFEQQKVSHHFFMFAALGLTLTTLVILGYIFYRILTIKQELKQELQQSAFIHKALDEHAIVSITDAKGKILYANSKFEVISGYPSKELIGKTHRVVCSGIHESQFFQSMWRRIARGQVWHGDVCNRNKNGDLYWVSSTIVPFLNQEGKPTHYISIRTDITKQKQVEHELQQARRQAELANRIKGEFLANMSHEIRTPLNAIIGLTQLAEREARGTSWHHYLQKIQGASKSLLSIINDILDLSKIEAKRLQLEHIPFDLDEVLTHVSDVVGFKAAEKGIEFIFDFPKCLPNKLIGDPLRLGQILVNLTSNAVKFTDQGEVIIRIQVLAQNAETVRLRFSVLDTGIGMSLEQQNELFQAFTQADTSTTRRYGGTGLGLAISKELVELMQGEIQVKSIPGEGSEFSFCIPLSYNKDHIEEPLIPANTWVRVLVIEDHPLALEAATHQLEHLGLLAEGASNGQQGLHLFQNAQAAGQPYHLVLIDWRMPHLDGFEVARRLRQLAPKTPLVLCTAMDTQALANTDKSLIDAILYKPYSPNRLLQQIYNLLSQPCELELQPLYQYASINPDARILIAEDNLLNREALAKMLTPYEVQVRLASQGAAALQICTEWHPHLVLMDLDMPIMDGYEAATHILHALPERAPILIGLTNSHQEATLERAYAVGMQTVLKKPLDTLALDRLLAQYLSTELPAPSEIPVTVQTLISPPKAHLVEDAKLAELALNGMQVLLVEDDPINRQVARLMLKTLGVSVTEAINGEEAVRLYQQRKADFDIVLMDWHMPVMDGPTATALIRQYQQENALHCPILALSANVMANDQQTLIQVKMDACISKPIELETLGFALKTWWQPHSASEQAEQAFDKPDWHKLEATFADALPELVSLFIETNNQLIKELETYADQQEALLTDAKGLEAVKGIAHRLKSSSASLQLEAFSALAKQIEHGIRDQEYDHLITTLTDLIQAYPKICDELNHWLESHT